MRAWNYVPDKERQLRPLRLLASNLIRVSLFSSFRSRYFSPAFLLSSIARHAMPFVTFGGIFQCSFSRILSGRLRLFRPNLIWTRLCRPFFVIFPDI